MTDEEFIANVDAVNELINKLDDQGLGSDELRGRLADIYLEFPLRIYGKSNIQYTIPLLRSL